MPPWSAPATEENSGRNDDFRKDPAKPRVDRPGSDRGDFPPVPDIWGPHQPPPHTHRGPHQPPPSISTTALPGVGIRYELTTRAGTRLGVVAHRHGRRDLLVYDRADPDAARESIPLSDAESTALAVLLQASGAIPDPREAAGDGGADVRGRGHPIGRFAVDWVLVPQGSPWAGRSIGTAGVRSITGVSIVAVLRADAAFPSPGPDFSLEAGDTALVVGTPEGVEALVELLED